MLGSKVPPTRRIALVAAVLAIAGVTVQASLPDDDTSSSASAGCSTSNRQTVAVDVAAARRIYDAELHGRESKADAIHVQQDQALLRALATGSLPAVRAAVHRIVYTPHWHIVRLRVLRGGKVLADVGGPHVIAPVDGVLRSAGHTLGTYVMSVQDDLGYMKLVTRFIGVPLDLYSGHSQIMGTLSPAPPVPPGTGTSVTVKGRTYLTELLHTRAFPAGQLTVGLFVPVAGASSSTMTCAAVRAAAWGAIGAHLAARFKPLPSHYQALVDVLRSTTGGLAYVRSGSQRIAGGPGPKRIPISGSVTYRGRPWSVYSWEPVPPARIYLLTPPG